MHDPRLTPERADRELAMMRDSARWPMRTMLPLKRMPAEGGYTAGYLEVDAPGQRPEPVVHVDDPDAGAGRYPSFEAIHEAGWLVD